MKIKNNITLLILIVTIFFIMINCSKKEHSTKELSTKSADTLVNAIAPGDTILPIIFIQEDTIWIKDISSNDTSKKEVATKDIKTDITPIESYVIQIASYKQKSDADSLVEKLREKDYTAYSELTQNPSPNMRGFVWRVRIGSFKTFKDADDFGKIIKIKENFDYWVDRRLTK